MPHFMLSIITDLLLLHQNKIVYEQLFNVKQEYHCGREMFNLVCGSTLLNSFRGNAHTDYENLVFVFPLFS